jgi:excisionase family DNA binding protein
MCEVRMNKLIYRPQDVAEALGLCRSKVYQMLRTREIESFKVGKAILVRFEALQNWIAKRSAEEVDQ